MVRVHWVGILLPVVLLGCAPHNVARPWRDANFITEDEIVASHAMTAYEAIQKLRGNFLSNRGVTTIYASNTSPYPTVYVDGQIYGDASILQSIPAEVIATIRLYRSWEATTRYGMGNMGGVIAITTRQGGSQGGSQANAYRP